MPIERIDLKLCNGCRKCVHSCPMDVIRFDEETKKPIIKYQADCMACYNCELDCPTNAIYVTPFRGRRVVYSWNWSGD